MTRGREGGERRSPSPPNHRPPSPPSQGFYVFIRAIQALTHHNKGVVVVGLAGPSGSGKTVFSHKVQSLIPGCALISMDDYNDASRLVDGNFDDPRLTDYDTLLANVAELKAGRPARAPIYDFKSSKRVGYRDVAVPESRVVIIEGIYALSSRVRPLLDLRVSVTGGVHFDLVKRVLRDITRSGQHPEEIIQQISDTVYPMYKAFIEPDLKSAHLRIYNTFNPFSGFMDATYILKSDAPVTLAAARALLAENATVRDESETYDIYLLPPNEDPETCSSWLRMRNRDGRYSLMFEEWVVDGPFIISPRISFEVGVRVLGGLMALGYEIGTIMKRTSATLTDGALTVKLDDIEGMGRTFVQVQGKDRAAVAAAGAALGLDGAYIPRSYIELVQLEKLTESFRAVTDDLRRRFAVGGEPLFDEDGVGTPPSVGRGGLGGGLLASGFTRTTGFAVNERPTLASSAPTAGGVLRLLQQREGDRRSDGGGSEGGGDGLGLPLPLPPSPPPLLPSSPSRLSKRGTAAPGNLTHAVKAAAATPADRAPPAARGRSPAASASPSDDDGRAPSVGTTTAESAAALADACGRLAAAVETLEGGRGRGAAAVWSAAVAGAAVGSLVTLAAMRALAK